MRALDAALRVLRSGGVGAVTMRSVAAQAGVTATALYRHFESKDALIRDVTREVAALFRDYIAEGLDRDDPWERLIGMLAGARAFAIDNPRFYELLFIHQSPDGPRRRYPRDFRAGSGIDGLLIGQVESCMEAGRFRKDEPVAVAFALASYLHGLMRLWFRGRFGKNRAAFERFVDASFDRMFAGLAPPA